MKDAERVFIGAMFVGEKTGAQIENFWMVGIFSVVMTIVCIGVCTLIKKGDH
ncbi:MAG: hypothetical protein K2X86_16685 [Cytophagaceae bacterium]|nr:hypothetical protein [Cytophagaceae bacterium]